MNEAKPAINTHVRLFDLVRYQRSELHRAELITDEEYTWLCTGPMAMSPKGGSPSRQRLEDYDELAANHKAALAKLTAARKPWEQLKTMYPNSPHIIHIADAALATLSEP